MIKGGNKFLENKLENTNKECGKQEINMQNKLDMVFQLFQAIGGPNHMIMEYFLLNQCNHKVGLNGPMAYYLAWHIRLDSSSQIIPWGYDGIHQEFLWTKANETSQI